MLIKACCRLWEDNGLYRGAGARSSSYLGENVLKVWDELGCRRDANGFAPIVEQDYGIGTAHGHFDEACMDLELMSGLVDDGMTLSKFTVATLDDLGYTVDYSQAEDMAIPTCCRSGNVRRKKQSGERQRRRLSKEVNDAAVGFGKLELKRYQEMKANIENDVELQHMLRQNNAVLRISNVVTVFVEEGGHIVDVDVVEEQTVDHTEQNIFSHKDTDVDV